MIPLILDGSNLCLQGQLKKRNIQSLGALLPCLQALILNGIEAYVIFDASFRYRIDPKSKAAAEYKALLELDEKFQMAPAGMEADAFILEFAALRDFGVLSDDTFKKYLTFKGRAKTPHFHESSITLHKFQMMMGALVIPSLNIRYLIDETALDVMRIIAERNSPPHLDRPQGLSPEKGSADQPAQASAADSAHDELIELSPLFLRSSDLFEIHRRITGKSWKVGNSRRSAEEFASQCFQRPVSYVQFEDRPKNDGYFFDTSYSEAKYAEVRSYLMENCTRLLPLMGSARTRLRGVLELIYSDQLSTRFDFPQLCSSAHEHDLAYYETYLRSLLFALIAADGVRGVDESETDIATILKGEMYTAPCESRTEMLNFFQRGVLYLVADSDNRIPELISANLDWIFQLPRDAHVKRVIIKGHLDWLASIDA